MQLRDWPSMDNTSHNNVSVNQQAQPTDEELYLQIDHVCEEHSHSHTHQSTVHPPPSLVQRASHEQLRNNDMGQDEPWSEPTEEPLHQRMAEHVHDEEDFYDDDSDMDLDDDSDDDDEDEEDDQAVPDNENQPVERRSSQELAHQQAQMRQRIMEIQRDPSIPQQEKAKRIQELMTQKWTTKTKAEKQKENKAWNRLTDKNEDFNTLTDQDKQLSYHNQEAGILGCKHYQRAAKLQAHCCGKWFTCRFCHDEVSDHNIVRNLTTTMMCMYCSTVQPAGQDCINPACGKRVASYYCQDCKLWDDDRRKNIYHCKDCGICRIGKGLGIDYFHCQTCNICMAISLKGKHKCIERNLESDCPICGEYMFTSTTTVIFMPCGHCIHYKCHQEYTQTNYQCPTCFKSLANMTEYFRRIDMMLEQHKMPAEYDNTRSFVYCNDCEKKCWAKYHFLYHKCVFCQGYNTKVLHTKEFKVGEVLPDISPRGLNAPESSVTEENPGGGEAALETISSNQPPEQDLE